MEAIRVLFVCSGNDCLSPMAEGFLRRYGGSAFDVSSAGVEPAPLDRIAADLMQRSGVDISNHVARSLEEVADQVYDFVINVSEGSRDAVTRLANTHRLIHWRFPNPGEAAGSAALVRKHYQRVRDEVAGRVRLFAYAQTRRRDRRPGTMPMAG